MPDVAALARYLTGVLAASPLLAPDPLEDFSARHLAKATGTTRSALRLIDAGHGSDAAVLVRTVLEGLFTYMWVVQDPARASVRGRMVDLKQAWANAKYLEALALRADEADAERLMTEAAGSRAEAEGLLDVLAEELGTTPKKVRDEATLRASLKGIEVNLGPRFSVPYARYSGIAHSDGHSLAGYGVATPAGVVYGITGGLPPDVPLADDLHHALLRLALEVRARCPRLGWPDGGALLIAHSEDP